MAQPPFRSELSLELLDFIRQQAYLKAQSLGSRTLVFSLGYLVLTGI
jgi:hypothetical protein